MCRCSTERHNMTVAEIKKKKLSLEKCIRNENEWHRYKMGRFKNLMKILQESCKHRSKTFFGDPTGSDSYYKCNTCGAELILKGGIYERA
jgi:hypothetical protein